MGCIPIAPPNCWESWGRQGRYCGRSTAGQVKATDAVLAAARTGVVERREQLVELGVSFVLRGGSGYPQYLAELLGAPDALFVRGEIPAQMGVAVVGTRRCSAYGRGLARRFGEVIADAGWPLISGLARGIDGEAHRGTVAANGVGVAVLGSGPDVWYPSEHKALGEEVIGLGGAVITEYPPGTVPEPWRFPPRKIPNI